MVKWERPAASPASPVFGLDGVLAVVELVLGTGTLSAEHILNVGARLTPIESLRSVEANRSGKRQSRTQRATTDYVVVLKLYHQPSQEHACSCDSNRAEAGQTVGVSAGTGSQAGLCLVFDGFEAEAQYGGEFSSQGVAIFAQ